jgi:hypothetical protein
MEINIEVFQSSDECIDTSINSLKSSYDTEWNDSVHDSFQNYIDETSLILEEIRELSQNLATIGSDLENIDIDTIADECDSINSEIEAV